MSRRVYSVPLPADYAVCFPGEEGCCLQETCARWLTGRQAALDRQVWQFTPPCPGHRCIHYLPTKESGS